MRLFCAISFVSGFIALSYEILWIRFFSFMYRGSPLTFGLVVGFYLFGIALGAHVVKRFVVQAPERLNLLLASLLVLCSLGGCAVIPVALQLVKIDPDFVSLSYLLLLPVTAVFGAVFPLLVELSVGERNVGSVVSYLFAANILGATLGTVVTGFFLLHYLPLADTAMWLSAFALMLALIPLKDIRHAFALIAPAVLLLVFVVDPMYNDLYSKAFFRNAYGVDKRFTHVQENRHGVIAVTNDEKVYGGGVYDGTINTSLDERFNKNSIDRVYISDLFDANAKRVLQIGLSTGSWAQVLAHRESIETLKIIEINPGYLELIAGYAAVRSLLDNPKVEIEIDDGRRYLLRNVDERFDSIVMNSRPHWVNSATLLLSREFFSLMKSRLAPGGLVYINTTWCDSVVRTAKSVFKHVYRYKSMVIASDRELSFDRDAFATRLRRFAIDGELVLDLNEGGLRDVYQKLVAYDDFYFPEDYFSGDRPIITDDNVLTEFALEFCPSVIHELS